MVFALGISNPLSIIVVESSTSASPLMNVVMISFGASDVNVSCVVAQADAERAVKSLHQEFFGESR